MGHVRANTIQHSTSDMHLIARP